MIAEVKFTVEDFKKRLQAMSNETLLRCGKAARYMEDREIPLSNAALSITRSSSRNESRRGLYQYPRALRVVGKCPRNTAICHDAWRRTTTTEQRAVQPAGCLHPAYTYSSPVVVENSEQSENQQPNRT
jgi:hypothetical protein